MNASEIDKIVRELCELLDEQIKTISGKGFNDLSDEELNKYRQRTQRIAVLRGELSQFARPH